MAVSVDEMKLQLATAVRDAAPGLAAANGLCAACVDLLGVDGAAISMMHEGASQGTFGSSSAISRRLDEYQFTFGEGPCVDAATTRKPVLAADLDLATEQRWPAFAGAVLGDGIRAVFALPVMMASVCVGALDLFRQDPGSLRGNALAGGLLAAELASLPLLDLVTAASADDAPGMPVEEPWERLGELDRLEVHQATGFLIAQLAVPPTEALARLRAHAVSTGQTASEVARAIMDRRLVLDRDERGPGHDATGRQP